MRGNVSFNCYVSPQRLFIIMIKIMISPYQEEMDDVFDYERNEEDDFYNILGCSEHSTVRI